MSIELAEKLKAKLTDKYVVVDASVPELRRFADWTGQVKTVNMNCRALVQFDGPADIGWYDIDPAYLTVVDAPRPRPVKEEVKAHKPVAAPVKPAGGPAATEGKSPLDLIRAQQAAKAAGAAAPATAGAAKPSPLELVRAQQAAKSGAPAEAATGGAKLSPIELIRQQQAAKKAAAVEESTAAAPAPEPTAAPAPVAETPAATPTTPTTGPDGKPLSKIELIRRQGAAKR